MFVSDANMPCLKCALSVFLKKKKIRVDLGEVDPPKKPRLEKQENRSSPITVQTSKDLLPNINDDETSADDFAMEMGLACVVCRYMLNICRYGKFLSCRPKFFFFFKTFYYHMPSKETCFFCPKVSQ